jgi:hypothetical protein
MSGRAKKIAERLIVALGLVVGLGLMVMPAGRLWACTPPPGGLPDYTPADRTEAAEVVLEGTIVGRVDTSGYPWLETALVKVHRYFKGTGPALVTISHFGPGALCLSEVYIGQRAIFYTRGDPDTGLVAHYLSQFDAVDPVHPEVVAEVIAAAGQEPVLPVGYWLYLPLILKGVP